LDGLLEGRGIGAGWLIGEDGKVGREEGKMGKEEGKEKGKGDVYYNYCLNQSAHDTNSCPGYDSGRMNGKVRSLYMYQT